MSRQPYYLEKHHIAREISTPRSAVAEMFARAVREHQAGRLDKAKNLYLQILAINVHHADSLHLLGMVEYQSGRLETAVKMIHRAIAINGREAAYHFNLGLVLQCQNKLDEAVAEYQQALALKPDCAEALNNMGNALQGQGKLAEAITCYQRALVIHPNYVDACYNLGGAFKCQNQLEDAKAQYERTLALKPDHAEACCNLGIVFREQGELETAKKYLKRALALKSNCAEAYCGLGSVLLDQDKLEDAKTQYERALTITPNYAEVYNNLGNVFLNQGILTESIRCYERALALRPAFAEATNNLGNAFRAQGKVKEAQASYERAMAINPNYVEAQWHRSLIQLLQGDFADGWRNYECRFHRKKNKIRIFSQPLWRGETLNGARILLDAEQGLGDSIQFLRYLPMVQAAGGSVVLSISPRLRRMAEQLPGLVDLVVSGDPLPPFDCYCPLMSLPLALGTTLETIPAKVPYLTVPEEALRAAATLPWFDEGLRVGLAWAGNSLNKSDRLRSMPLSVLQPLFNLKGVHFFSLQIGPAASQLERFHFTCLHHDSFQGGFFLRKKPLSIQSSVKSRSENALAEDEAAINDLASVTSDMADTAAQIVHLDLVITVDTAVAHLAGALAQPTWVLLPFAADWRWMLDREDSPWYPTMRLFRQPKPGDWQSVVENVCTELAALARGDRKVLKPGISRKL
jgi:tetratricopeptide (TPR) repeat protein